MTPHRCICYTTDTGYLFPTFVSAIQARTHTPPELADIAIFCIGISSEQEKHFSAACASEGIRLLPVAPDKLEGANAMLARLFLDRLVPDEYHDLLYIDGDTQIKNLLTPLLLADVPDGRFLAATDPLSFSLQSNDEKSQRLTSYFSEIGLNSDRHKDYFNSGVLRINRSGWDATGREAWALYKTLRGQSRYPDQDALNLVAMDRRIPMSLTWNFPVFLRNAGLEPEIAPRIIHYMGNPKPWHGQFAPWSFSEYETYLQAIRRYPQLAPYIPNIPRMKRLKYSAQQSYKKVLETATWGSQSYRGGILRYERSLLQPSTATS